MKPIKSFDELTKYLQSRESHNSIAVVCPYDEHKIRYLRSLNEVFLTLYF